MSKITICTRQKSKPFYIKEVDKNIFSIEELCYYLGNYLYLIDDDFFSDELIEYIDEVLEEHGIAAGLVSLGKSKESFPRKVSYIIRNGEYYTQSQAAAIEKQIISMGSRSYAERQKARADILIENAKYSMAIRCYMSILATEREKGLPDRFFGDVYNNMGVAYAGLFEYEKAATSFRAAYRLSGQMESIESVILCDLLSGNSERLLMDKQKYDISEANIDSLSSKIKSYKEQIDDEFENVSVGKYLAEARKNYVLETEN